MNIGNPLRKKSPISRYNVTLQDGSTVDVCSEEGANAFLRQASSSNCDLISSLLKKIKKIRRKKRLNPNDKHMISENWSHLSAFVLESDPKLFREKILETEIQLWLEHVIDVLKKLTTTQTWIQSGTLGGAVEDLALFSCVPMFEFHAVPVVLAFESEFFSILTDFVKACKGSGVDCPHH
mmetsp:Transcript_27214/g.66042  ORF Transcript_27214/g.66042 Transcript_27214/m.66042 type:complete len:180 (+) Transcript_27214:793-1332(+)